jgi:hypothetical protein
MSRKALAGRACAVIAAVAVPPAVLAQDSELPPADLLEYLGSWQDDDEEWFVEAEIDQAPEKDSGAKRKRVDDDEQ